MFILASYLGISRSTRLIALFIYIHLVSFFKPLLSNWILSEISYLLLGYPKILPQETLLQLIFLPECLPIFEYNRTCSMYMYMWVCGNSGALFSVNSNKWSCHTRKPPYLYQDWNSVLMIPSAVQPFNVYPLPQHFRFSGLFSFFLSSSTSWLYKPVRVLLFVVVYWTVRHQ